MTHELRIIIEKVSVSSQEVVKRDTIKVYDIKAPESITDLGLRHAEQISLLEKVQNALLAEQSILINTGVEVCPNCGAKLKKFGCRESDFHVNNHTQVKRITNKVGEVISEQNCQLPSSAECGSPAQDLIVQVDGGHIPIQEKNKRSFEALSAIVYRPENLQVVNKHHRQLVSKTCVISAKEDKLQTMKTYVINAALKQGISRDTHLTALADGANNCWSILRAL